MSDDVDLNTDNDQQPKIPDVNGIPFGVLIGHDDSVIDNSLRRLLREIGAPTAQYGTGHSSSL